MVFHKCDGLRVSGLSFFGTAVLVDESPGAEISSNSFRYPSASRRAMGGTAAEDIDFSKNFGIQPHLEASWKVPNTVTIPSIWIGGKPWLAGGTRARFSDNRIFRSEGSGLYLLHGMNDLVENNEVVEAGYPFDASIFVWSFRGHGTVRRNTVRTSARAGIEQIWGPSW